MAISMLYKVKGIPTALSLQHTIMDVLIRFFVMHHMTDLNASNDSDTKPAPKSEEPPVLSWRKTYTPQMYSVVTGLTPQWTYQIEMETRNNIGKSE